LYVLCAKQPGVSPCTTVASESSGQIAWRVFKERFSSLSGQPSCFLDENADGCSFDHIDMQADITTNPVRYDASANACSQIIAKKQSGVVTYVCMGIPSRLSGGTLGFSYKRSVYLEKLPTFEATAFEEQDNDDVRVTADVTYKAVNGSARSIKIVRYIHPRP
jgi:hypothetical protein